jgi:hypothetical protein
VIVTGDVTDPLSEFRRRLQDLFIQVRRPTYRRLEAHADQDGRALRISTLSALLNGSATPRWDTVETYIRACARYARARNIRIDPQLLDLDRWHSDYRAMENKLADQAAHHGHVAGSAARRRRPLATPAQLPASPPAFTGRTAHLADLDELLRSDNGEQPGTVVISAIDGTAGVGKTALALHWARQVADHFPDGQLYVNLRGFDLGGDIVDPASAVRGFLDALDVPPQRIPRDLDAQAALYRSVLAGRRMLIILDNARDTAQVCPLLPGAPGCLVVVTSRNQLASLIATHGAHPITLDLLTVDEAQDLLSERLGVDRTTVNAEAIHEIINRCARLPLALTLVAAHAALHPNSSLDALARQLRDTQHRWLTLTGDNSTTDVRSVFSWSYHTLTSEAARLFRLLGLHPGPDITPPAAASLLGDTSAYTQRLLTELARTNLIREYTTGRYTLHDLLHAYANDLTEATDPEDHRRAAAARLFDYYMHTAHDAARLLDPHKDPIEIPLTTPATVVNPDHFADRGQANSWLAGERRVLLSVLRYAIQSGHDTRAWQLAWTLRHFLDRQGHVQDLALTGELAAAAAQRMDTPIARAFAERIRARAHSLLGHSTEADECLNQALRLCALANDPAGQGWIHTDLALNWASQSRYDKSVTHSRQALALFAAADNLAGRAHALNDIGWYHTMLGNHAEGVAYCESSLALWQDLGNMGGEDETLASLGYAHRQLGNYAQAIECYQRSIALFAQHGNSVAQGRELVALGDTHHDAGDNQAASHAYRQAHTVLAMLDHPEAEVAHKRLAALPDS